MEIENIPSILIENKIGLLLPEQANDENDLKAFSKKIIFCMVLEFQ